MRTRTCLILALAASAALALPAAAQQRPAAQPLPPGLMGDLLGDAGQVHRKLVALARAIPADKHGWRPAEGVRSVHEVLLHVASDNYLLPAMLGVPLDPAVGIDMNDLSTLSTYERRPIARDSVIAELERSFEYLAKAMRETPATSLSDTVKFFNTDMSRQRVWILTTTHLHEHLGQLIAYARANGVVPPWSAQGG